MSARWTWRQLGLLVLTVCLCQAIYWLVIERQIYSGQHRPMPEMVEFPQARIARLASPDQDLRTARFKAEPLPFTHCCDGASFAAELDFDLADVPAAGLGIISTLQVDNYRLYANGHLLVGEGSMRPGAQTFEGQKTFLTRIPAGVLRPGGNTLTYVTLRDGFPYTDIYPPMVAEHDALAAFANQRLWVMGDFVAFGGLLMALVGLVATIMLARSDDWRFAMWLSLLAGSWAAYALYSEWLAVPLSGWWRMAAYFVINMAIPTSLLCFVDSWSGRAMPRLQAFAVLAYVMAVGAILAMLHWQPMPGAYDNAANLWGWFMALFAVGTALRFVWHFTQMRDDRYAEAGIMSVIVVALALEALAQQYPDLNLGEGQVHNAAVFFIVAMLAAFLARNFRLFQSQNALNAMLRARVEQREGELAQAHAREQVLVARQAHDDERRRIMRDIHDGLGGQLMTMLLSARLGEADPPKLAEGLQAAIDELRLMVDSMDSVGESLDGALSTFRARVKPRVETAGITFDWHQPEGLTMPEMEPRAVLQVFRILQEAVTNALKHARCTHVRVVVAQHGNGLDIAVCDNGRGGAAGGTAGRGRANMAIRAQAIGGTVAITDGPDGGTHVALRLAGVPCHVVA